MTYFPDTTTLLVADRRGAREASARRYRLFRRTAAPVLPTATLTATTTRLPAPTGRTPAGAAVRAA